MSSKKKLESYQDDNASADGSTEGVAEGGDVIPSSDIHNGMPARHSLGTPLGLGRRSIPLRTEGNIHSYKNYPHDTYSFIGNPKSKPISFVFGLMVFSIQVSLMLLFIFDETQIFKELTSGNEHEDSEHPFLPANVEPIVRASQYLALLSYILFSDGAMEDVTTAIDLFRFQQEWQMRLSSFLRLFEGSLAVTATTLLIMQSGRVGEAVLSILAVEFISQLDNLAFELMRIGRYSATLQREANKIADDKLPEEYVKSYNNASAYKPLIMLLVFVATFVPMAVEHYNENINKYVVDKFRVEFEDNDLKIYDGCYSIEANHQTLTKEDIVYTPRSTSTPKGSFRFCVNEDGTGSWVLYEGRDNLACKSNATPVARSSASHSFNIADTFEKNWFDVIWLPIDAAFFEASCEVRNGICNPEFNKAKYGWDGGDCCANTCQNPECHSGIVTNAFKGALTGMREGFRNCQDPTMLKATITITSVETKWYQTDGGKWKSKLPPLMTFKCENQLDHFVVTVEEKMRNMSETVFFEDWSLCSLDVSKGEKFMSVNYKFDFHDFYNFVTTQELKDAVDSYLVHGPSRTIRYGEEIEFWDVSRISDFSRLFSMGRNPKVASFNSSLAKWDTSRATDMSGMFLGASLFNSDVSSWNVEKVTSMHYMFESASSFNSDLSSWNVEKVTNMDSIFLAASAFNSDISLWNVGKVTCMCRMFESASTFNSDLSAWDVGKVTDMNYMFTSASSFSSDVSLWNVGKVTSMRSTFNTVSLFNSDVSLWNVGKVTNMRSMFRSAYSFNSDVSSWNVGNVTNMKYMFSEANSFNNDVSMWNVEKVSKTSYMFWNASSFNIDVSLWQVNKVTDMSGMFIGASVFDQNLCYWGNKLSAGVAFDGGIYGRIFESTSCPCEGNPDLNVFPRTTFCACDCNWAG